MKTPRIPFLHRSVSAVLAYLMVFQSAVPTTALAGPAAFTPVSVQNVYDGNGNLTQRTDGNGAVTTFGYDAKNRLISVDYPGGGSPDVSFTYDQNGNRIGMTDATGTTTYDYDLFDRLISIVYPNGNFVFYGYDNVGNRTDLQYGNLLVLYLYGVYTYIHYTFDADNCIASVKNMLTGDITAYTYDAAENTSRRTLPNGAYTDYGYDLDGRLTSVVHRKADNSLICQYVYTLNAIGNRTSVTETTPGGTKTTSYTYDPLDRLDTVTYPDGRFVDYDYDSFGNRTNLLEITATTTNRTAYLYDSDSRLLSTMRNGAPEETFAYDTTGNLLQQYRVTDGRLIDYVFDTENRLVRVLNGTNNVEYVYNGVGERVAKVVNGVRMNYINDPNRQYVQVLAETDAAGVAQRVYEWGNELINQEDIYGGARNYYLHDAINGSVRRLVNAGQSVVNSYEYDPFGTVTAGTEGVANNFRFQGEVQEQETGLVFLRARYADTSSGRFLTRDLYAGDLRRPSSLNPYVLFANDPINGRDPQGTVVWWIPGAVGAIWGGITYTAESYLLGDEWTVGGCATSMGAGAIGAYTRIGGAISSFGASLYENTSGFKELSWSGLGEATLSGGLSYAFGGINPNWGNTQSLWSGLTGKIGQKVGTEEIAGGLLETFATSLYRGFTSLGSPGGVALNKSANVLLNINNITGGTYDPATGQILLYGTSNSGPTALPPMSLDDLAVAFKAVNQGTMPVVSIEDPIVLSPPEWPGRDCFTVRYGPFVTDPDTGAKSVLDVSSKTHFGWVMYDADRQMKCLGMGKDNRALTPVSSGVSGYHNWVDLALSYWNGSGSFQTRFWFNPKDIEVTPSADGKSMELRKAEMQLSTECMFASNGQTESTPDAEYYANWFTANYDAIANEQVTLDNTNGVHYIFKELKQLAYLVGIVKWVQDNNIPMDLSFLQNYTPQYYASAPSTTPRTTSSGTRRNGNWTYTVTIQGGVNYCKDLAFGTNGNPTGLAAAALTNRVSETNLAWNFSQNGTNYNVTALSVDRKEKDGGFSHGDTDASLKVQGALPLGLGRYFDSFNIGRTMLGYGWQAQPYALEFKGERTSFNLCAQTWEGYGEIMFNDRGNQAFYRFVPSGIYDRTNDPLHIISRFATNTDILVYSFQTKDTPGKLYSDNKTRMVMRLANGVLLDFNLDGLLTRTEDRNGNAINYNYDSSCLASMSQPGGRTISFNYDAQNKVTSASLPDGHSVTYSYDGTLNLVSAQYDAPTGRIIRYAYSADHALTEVQDESGSATQSRSFDVYGRAQATTQPGVATPIAQNFNLANRTTQVTGPNAYSQKMEYNTNYDAIRITDARSNTVERTYNSYRDVITEKMTDNRIYQYFYDSRGNRIATQMPNGRADMSLLDINNNPTFTFHSSSGTNFTGSFDSEHVLTSFGGGIYSVDFTSYQYDAKGNLTAVIDANSHTNTFGYDATGNRTLARDARGYATGFGYDANSRLSWTTNALGHRVDYTYDDRDNLTRTATQAGTVDNVYNAKSELVGVIKGDIGARRTNSYAHNAKHQIQSVTDPAGAVTVYAYDARGNLTNITHAGITRFSYEYDGLNRLTATRYSGTAGGGKAAIIPAGPRGTEKLKGAVTITWNRHGDWGSNTNLTMQYSVDGVNWTNIATVAGSDGSYVWNTGNLVSDSVRIRFVRPGDATFVMPVTATFSVLNGGKYYVNDDSTAGDNYCSAIGNDGNDGQSAASPKRTVQAIIDNYPLQPGDMVFIDTGNYPITNDIVITTNDDGYFFKPVTFTGPTNGGAAVITHLNLSNSAACIVINGAEGIIVENLKLTGARHGIQLVNALYCTVQKNECCTNGVPGAPGQEGSGAGIRVGGEGGNLIENNICHHNGANGGVGMPATTNLGGAGRGFGIIVESSYGNEVRSNICYLNGGQGGAAGSTNALPGYSEGAGIFVQTVQTNVLAEGNHVTDNTCYDNGASGMGSSAGYANKGQGFGIALLETTNSTIERNIVYGNDGRGGNSDTWDGGFGWGVGIYGQGEATLTVCKNHAYANKGWGGWSGSSSSVFLGDGEGGGISLNGCSNSIVKNNLAWGNFGFAWDIYGSEQDGIAYGYGVRLKNSPGCEVSNNTLYRNWAMINNNASAAVICGQIYAGFSSTNGILKNNICEAYHYQAHSLYVSETSQAGLASDYNDLYTSYKSSLGVWGTNSYLELGAWKTNTSQDSHSLGVDPGFYNVGATNFHLAYNSPCIDAGQNLATVQEDGDSEPRPADGNGDLVKAQDIGYDEFIDSDSDNLADIIETTVTMTDPNNPDSDGDGLPDGWEVQYGLDPKSSTGINGASGDPDGDGYNNLAEYLANSNPMLASSIPNQPPVITAFSPAGAALFILEEQSVAFSATATDANNDPISYSWKLDGVAQSSSNSWVFLTTSESSGQTTLVKEYAVELIVTAGGQSVARQWTVAVNNLNHAPVLSFISNLTVRVGTTIQINPVYSDPDNLNRVPGDDNVLTVEYSGWMTNATRIATTNDYGSHAVTVTVRDNGSPSLSDAKTLTVTVLKPPTVDFTAEPTSGMAPLTVTFTNLSDGATNYTWTFGDGKSSTVEHPANTYTKAGSYTVTLTAIGAGGTNSLTRADYIVVTNAPPSITDQPLNQTVKRGSNATFNVTATGTPPLGYQWRFNAAAIAGATASSYTRASAQCTNAGDYDVVVTNATGSVTSSVATLTVIAPPAIAVQPTNQTIMAGSDATFTVTATNACGGGLTYQWRFNRTGIAGATAPSFTRTNARYPHGGNYDVVVTNAAGSVTSSVAVLTVITQPEVTFVAGSTNGPPEAQVLVPVQVNGFTNISVFQFSLHWSNTAAAYVGVEQFGLPGLAGGNFGTTLTNNGTLTVSWDDPDGLSKSVANGTTIFAVRLRLIGLPGTSNSVCIGGTPTVIGAANFDLEPVPVGTVCGQLTVNRRPVAFSQSLTNAEDAPLAITLTGSDVDRPVTNFTVLSAPTNGTLSGTAPELTYLPATNYYGPDSFTFTVDDGSLTSEVATVSITITNVNDAPVLASISDRTVHAGSTLVITNRASDPDVPPQSLVFSLTAAPVGASIGTNDGVFRWTPGESYIDTTNSVTVRVADNGTPSLDDAKSFLIAVVARPLIESISLSNNIVWLTWSAISGQTYRVQFKEAWENPHWTNVAPDVRASGSTVSATNNVGSAAQKFYRVMLVQ